MPITAFARCPGKQTPPTTGPKTGSWLQRETSDCQTTKGLAAAGTSQRSKNERQKAHIFLALRTENYSRNTELERHLPQGEGLRENHLGATSGKSPSLCPQERRGRGFLGLRFGRYAASGSDAASSVGLGARPTLSPAARAALGRPATGLPGSQTRGTRPGPRAREFVLIQCNSQHVFKTKPTPA